MDQINRVREVEELMAPPGNRLERLKGDREDQYSIRINQQYRICFIWEEGNAYNVEITGYHQRSFWQAAPQQKAADASGGDAL